MQKKYTSETGHSGYLCGGEEYIKKVVMGIFGFIMYCVRFLKESMYHR